jgi:hypothetical protein
MLESAVFTLDDKFTTYQRREAKELRRIMKDITEYSAAGPRFEVQNRNSMTVEHI